MFSALIPMVLLAVMSTSQPGEAADQPTIDERPRVIVTTDGEIDDRCSMIRYLVYANEWDTLGLIHSSSKHHWKGDEAHKAHSWQGTAWLDKQIDLYEQVYPSLKRHDPNYPSPDYLRKQVFVGNIAYEGEMTKVTPGSQRIVEVLLEDDPRPVWLQAWGGSNTIARALKTIKDEHPDRVDDVSAKAVIYLITYQDNTYKKYIAPNWPKVQVIANQRQFAAIAYSWKRTIPKSGRKYFNDGWMRANIIDGHGPLNARYSEGRRRFISEGDSPAFMHTIDTGLRTMENLGFGGWGGRFRKDKRTPSLWRDAEDDGSRYKSIWRWAAAFQNDWAARADWCVKDFGEANHPPKVALAHPADLKAKPGEKVMLSAKGTQDPDGDSLAFRWWVYREPSTCQGAIDIDSANAMDASFTVPADAKPGQTIHVICEVTDDGTPPLTRYRRVIVTCED